MRPEGKPLRLVSSLVDLLGQHGLPRRYVNRLTATDYSDVEAMRIWNSYKPLLYAISAIIISRFVVPVYNERTLQPPYGLVLPVNVSPNSPRDTFTELRTAMHQTLSHASHKELAYLEDLIDTQSTDKLCSIADGFFWTYGILQKI